MVDQLELGLQLGGRDTGQVQGVTDNTQQVPGVACITQADNLDYLADVADESVKLVVTSPPYNLGKAYEQRSPLDAYLAAQSAVIAEAVRVLHPAGSICWQVGNYVDNGQIVPLDILLYDVFAKHDLRLRNRIVWHFGHGLHCTRRLSGRYETILWVDQDR